MADVGAFLQGLKAPISNQKVYSKKVLTNETSDKLIPYQTENVVKLINILLDKRIAIDGSDAGVGKTYMAMAICREMGRRPIVICPKTIMYNWVSVAEYMGVKLYDVVNYETIKNGKTYVTKENNDGGTTNITYSFKSRKASPFVTHSDFDADDPQKCLYEWNLPADAILIVDEAHKCKEPSAENGKFLKSMKTVMEKRIPVLLLSATICEKIQDMKIPFYLFGFIPEIRNFNHYHQTLDEKYRDLRTRKRDFQHIHPAEKRKEKYEEAKKNNDAIKVHREVKDYMSRIKIKDLGDKFPSNQWCAQLFNADGVEEITEAYAEIARRMEEMKGQQNGHHLGEIVRLKQEIELRKIPIFIDQAQDFLDQGKSVIIFVNYLRSLQIISDELDIKCKIYGGNEEFGVQSLQERQKAIEMFQANEERIIICQMRSGSVGISLHDLDGNYPRATLINYPDTATDLIQAMGRACRSGGKSPVIQRIILVGGVPYEKKIKQNIDRKLTNVSAINDGDLEGYKYKINDQRQKKKAE